MAEPAGGGGDFRRLFDRTDWAASSLGPREGWSDTLRSAVDLALNTRFPVTLLWGPRFTMAYNAAYAPVIGDKHPGALGADAEDVFPEIWDIVGPMLAGVYETEQATWVEDTRLLLERHGFAEETYFTFSYSAVTNVDGEVEGLIDISAETTEQVIDRRRIELLARLGSEVSGLTSARRVCEAAAALLAEHDGDVVGVEIRHGEFAPFLGGAPLPERPAGARDGVAVRDGEHHVVWSRLSGVGVPSSIGIMLSPYLEPNETYLDFVRLIGVAVAQALNRIAVQEADARLASLQRELSVSMQESLLTEPVAPDHLEVAVRYRPAMEQAQIGGDWYDSFLLPDGTLTLAVGDVSGHDRAAAAAMAQVRNLLRGVAFTGYGPPARILQVLNETMRGLAVGSYATAIVAQVERDAVDAPAGRTLRWSNAGHPPPVLLDEDRARLLAEPPDLMLGVRKDSPRTDHTTTLRPGATIVFYTDGLIERRGEPIERGLAHLIDWLTARSGQSTKVSAQELCDALLDQFAGPETAHDDDVVLLVLRVRSGVPLHGTRAQLAIDDLREPGRVSKNRQARF